MRKIKNLIIGGIENKVFNLILFTGILITVAFMLAMSYQQNMLAQLSAETRGKQQETIETLTSNLMDQVVVNSMSRSTNLEAMIANELFHGLETRVRMLENYAHRLYEAPDDALRMPYDGPDPARNGEVMAQLMLADGVDGNDPALADRLGIAANMSDMMVSLFGASEVTNSLFIALPEGAFLVTDDRSATKFDPDGSLTSYDPRTRPWYIQAVEAGDLIFTDVEVDAFTGDIGIVCAMPVYVDGALTAVVGSDLFLTSMQQGVQASDENGGFVFIVNHNGHVVFSPKVEGAFKVVSASDAVDLRTSDNAELAALISDAMDGKTDVRIVNLEDGPCYMMGAPMKSVGWSLVSVFSQAMANEPVKMMRDSSAQIQAEAVGAYRARVKKLKTQMIIAMAALAVLLLANALLLGKRIVRPLNTIAKRISELSETNLEFKMEDAYRTGDEIEVLADSFAKLSHKTVQYVDQVKRVTAEKERVSVELQLSHDIQVNMLPNIFPAFPERKEFDIYASMLPAKEVGGDFYDFYLADERNLVMVIADVSGKGIPAAMFMMASKIIVNNISTLGVSDPASILEAANRQISSNNPAEMFVTMWLGILDLETGRLRAANAGHEYPFVMRRGGQFELLKDKHGFVLGGMVDCKYHTYELQLNPGDAIFVYTDGVAEANDADGQLFGMDRLTDALNREPDASCKELLCNVKAAVDAFVQDAPQFDDTTMLAVRYNGKA